MIQKKGLSKKNLSTCGDGHVPWVIKNISIPQTKLDAGTYEPSNSSYRSRWFCVIKKDKKSLRIVHSLEPLNAVTIAHSGLPPATEELAEQFSGFLWWNM